MVYFKINGNSWLEHFAVMRKWSRLFVNVCECSNLIYPGTEFLSSYQGGVYASVCSGTVLQNNGISTDLRSYLERCYDL